MFTKNISGVLWLMVSNIPLNRKQSIKFVSAYFIVKIVKRHEVDIVAINVFFILIFFNFIYFYKL